jgi:hypothetical protein
LSFVGDVTDSNTAAAEAGNKGSNVLVEIDTLARTVRTVFVGDREADELLRRPSIVPEFEDKFSACTKRFGLP